MATLIEHIAQETPIEKISEYLDGLSPNDRLAETRTLSKKHQRMLFDAAEKGQPLQLSHFVPENRADRAEVIHHGRNTLPFFRLFEKRFCRPDGDNTRLFGYNEGSTRGLIGPGYFVMVSTEHNSDWAARGSLVVDYFQVPDSDVVEGWPTVVPNSKGLQVLVYNKTRDFMRRVSAHVSIGVAYKGEKSMGQYFVLCRDDSDIADS